MKSPNPWGRPIHLCRYSDDPLPPAPGITLQRVVYVSHRGFYLIQMSDQNPGPRDRSPGKWPRESCFQPSIEQISDTFRTGHPDTRLKITVAWPNSPTRRPSARYFSIITIVFSFTIHSPIANNTHVSPWRKCGWRLATIVGNLYHNYLYNTSIHKPDANLEQTLPSATCPTQSSTHFRSYRFLPLLQLMAAKLFPTGQELGVKSLLEKFMVLMVLPGVFLLVITLLLVKVEGSGSCKDPEFKRHTSDAASPLMVPGSPKVRLSSQPCVVLPTGQWYGCVGNCNRWLHSVKCIFAPLFVTFLLFWLPILERLQLYTLPSGWSPSSPQRFSRCLTTAQNTTTCSAT